MTHVDPAKVVEVKEKNESYCVRVIKCAVCALSSSFEFLLENRLQWLRLVVVFFRLSRPMLALKVILNYHVAHTYIIVSTYFVSTFLPL